MRTQFVLLTLLLLCVSTLAQQVPLAHAATPLVVNSTADNATGGDGNCTLREAITNLNAQNESSGGDCITGSGNTGIQFNVNGILTLNSALPDLNHDMFIDGGEDGVTISGNNAVRLFVINSPNSVALRRLTLTNGRAPNGTNQGMTLCTSGGAGGAIFNGGSLNLHEVRITASRAGTGGNSFNQPGCPGGDGGAIYNATTGTLNAYRSTFDNNDAGDGGDSGNGSGGHGADGGAIYNSGSGFVWLQNVTLMLNDRGYGGAGTTSGLHGDGPDILHNGGAMTLLFTTVWNSSLLGTLVSASGKTIVLRNSLLQNSGQNCSTSQVGTFTDAGYNIESGSSCGLSAAGSLAGTPSGLMTTLQNNGGYVPTLALNSTSAAIDHLNDGVNVCGSGGIADDARGVARPKNSQCDIGAYEYIGMPGTTLIVNHAFGFYDGYCDTLGTGFGSQDCTFMEAIDAANATPGFNTITFDIPDADPDCSAPDVCFIALLAPPAPISDDVTIDASAQHIILSGEFGNRILEINADVTAAVNALSFRNAKCETCSGAGIWNKGDLTVTNSTFRDNQADDLGGGIYNQGALNISNSTFTANSAGVGGAIANSGGALTMTNVTAAGNTSAVVGGIFSTGAVTINNTVSSDNSGGDCSTPFSNTGANNLSSDATCGATFAQKTVAEINLQAPADNGGNTFTMALLYPSAARDAADDTLCANAPINNLDQRGEPRPQDGDRSGSAACDIGAYEAPIPPATQIGPDFVVNHAADTDDGLCDALGEGFYNQDCTLREAIHAANAHSGADTITFDIPDTGADCTAANVCTITLGAALPALNDTTTIDGSTNDGDISISGNDAVRVFYINSGKTVTLDTLTIRNGLCDADCDGGAAIGNYGALTVKHSAILHNRAQYNSGGGIYNQGTLDLSNSTVANNRGGGSGGGIISYQGAATITNSTIVGNTAGNLGGGVYSFLNTLVMNNTLIAGNTGFGNDCVGTASGSNNLIQDSSSACGLSNGVNGNITGANPNLAALGENGGPTQTIAPHYPSDAIDRGDNTTCADAPVGNQDQRGSTRPIDGDGDTVAVCDIGAYEASLFTGTQGGPNFVVNQTADSDDGYCDVLGMGAGNQDCTLHEAINAANTSSGDDTITFDIPLMAGCTAANVCVITLGATLPAIADTVTIDGAANNGKITVSGNNLVRVFAVNSSRTLHLNALTVANGNCIGCDGGGISNSGILNITNSTLANNAAQNAGGILNVGKLTLVNSTLYNNSAGTGGALYNLGTATVVNSTLSNNTASSAVGGIENDTGTLHLANTIVANSTGDNCRNNGGSVGTNVNNWIEPNNSCGAPLFASDPNLGSLQDNGGPTETMALDNNSVAIDAGDTAVCADSNTVNHLDQRGEARDDLQCDLGAFEFVHDDGQTVVRSDLDSGPLYTFGPTLAGITSGSPYSPTLTIHRELTPPANNPPANALPISWDATTQGSGYAFIVTLCYDPGVLTGQNENTLHVFHYNGSSWDDLGGTLDSATHAPYHCVTAQTALTSLSPLILAPAGTTAVQVKGVRASINKKGSVVVRWKTTTESDIAGFNVYRRVAKGKWQMVNGKFIQAKHAGSVEGANYRFTNRKVKAGRTYRYKIEVIFLDGHTGWTNSTRVQVP